MKKLMGVIALALFVLVNPAGAQEATAGSTETTTSASQFVAPFEISVFQQFSRIQAATSSGLKWKVGDKASHKLSGGITNGTSETFVREDTGTQIWLQQDLNLGVLGKQKIEVQFNKATGHVEKILANGQEQSLPDTNNIEVVEMKEDRIKVAAGEFDCIYAKLKDKKSNQIQEAWLNPQAIPMSGMIKSISDSQIGKINQELTSFSFGK